MIMKISISFANLVPILLLLLSLAPTIGLGFNRGNFTRVLCSPNESDALLKLKHDLTDPSNRLASWVGDSDCCKWLGIVCHNVTGHVIELNLRSLSYLEYHDAFLASTAHHYEDYERYLLSGKINPSLLNLKHLMHLDLSNNDFGGIQIPKFLGSLGSLKYLNLSSAGFGGMIPHQLGNLSNLHYLNLNLRVGSFSSFSSSSSSYYSKHYYYNYKDYESYVENSDWVSGLSSLEFLDLSYVNLSKAFDWLDVVNNALPSLVQLHLSNCQLPPIPPLVNVNFSSLSILDLSSNYHYFNESSIRMLSHLKTLVSLNLGSNSLEGPIPNDLQNLTSLRELDLSWNQFNSSIPNWLYGFSRLELLNLGFNNLQGEVSNAIRNMTSLVSLDLSENRKLEFNRGIPTSFKYLCNLKVLSLSYLKLNQDIAEVFEILLGCVSDKLESLDLSGCQVFGGLTSHVGQFKNLAYLVLSHNQLNGTLPDCFGELASLRTLWLAYNRFNGTLPASFNALSKLESLGISNNLLVGDVFELHFANLTKLLAFYAGGNQLTLRVNPIDWIPPLQLEDIDLRSWNIGPQIPTWLRSLKHLSFLDLSNSSISSTVPFWFWNFSSQLFILNLSQNQIHGVIPSNLKLHFSAMYPTVDLSSNNFKGPLPSMFSDVYSLNLSNNSFSGSIINFLCHKMHKIMKNMRFLNINENFLSGKIPDCWISWQYLEAIKLSNNRFSGNIPKSLGTLSSLESLHLRNNSMSGELPESFKNCTKLVTLDIGENELTGNIPTWMGERISNMVVLNMRANKFHGHIPMELCNLAALKILDLAHNSLSGSIPTCVYNFSAMATRDDYSSYIDVEVNGSSSHFENQFLVMKGRMDEYSTILGLVRSIDFSNNALHGEIPTEITRLGELLSLNLSQNFLIGKIPKDIGVMGSLQCIDFSLNQLSGEIPPSMSSLTFLNHLNLSHNKLWGEIPTGTQLQSFSPSSFMGNELCGLPLSKNCSGDGTTHGMKNGMNEDGNGMVINWFYVSMAVGFIVGFWSVVGPLLFNRRCRYIYFHLLDRCWDKILWHFK